MPPTSPILTLVARVSKTGSPQKHSRNQIVISICYLKRAQFCRRATAPRPSARRNTLVLEVAHDHPGDTPDDDAGYNCDTGYASHKHEGTITT